jgi:AIPR protein
MENNRELHEFAEQLQQDIISVIEVRELFGLEAFTQHIIDALIEVGELEDGSYCYHKARGIEVCGYDLDSDDTLNLFTVIYTQMVPPTTVGKNDVESAFKRLNTFLQKTLAGPYYMELEESTDAFDMTEHIFESRSAINRVRLYLFTDGLTTLDKFPDTKLNELRISYHVWDIRRLYQAISSGKQKESIHIDFIEQFGASLPCLEGTGDTSDYAAYLTIIPGDILKSLYEQYGARLLELNVRSYLQAKGKVNQGIRRTILDQPGRFLAYNNGISTTASSIELVQRPEGGLGIKSLDDLQIVNGGQTTASIFHTALKDKADVSRLRVQAKISVIAPEHVASLVPLISRYANSQNKVNEADFSANDPFHVKLETLSRSIWAPAADGTQRQTRWFYERARGQYQDMINRSGTIANQRQFKATHPTAQKFTRTDLAKFEMTWEQFPHKVSLGAQKCFAEFNVLLHKKEQFEVGQYYFQRLVAKAILFRQAEAIISRQNFGGYRANIVTYTLAFICYHTGGRVNLDLIWQQQKLGRGMYEAIELVSHKVHEIIINPPGSKNVTEWCKRPACWDTIRSLQVDLPTSLQNELLSTGSEKDARSSGDSEASVNEEQKLIAQIVRIPASVWFQLATWARETRNLDAGQRRFVSSLGLAQQRSRSPSIKDAKQALLILEVAQRLGFKPEALVNRVD